jgi:hypothetical protein
MPRNAQPRTCEDVRERRGILLQATFGQHRNAEPSQYKDQDKLCVARHGEASPFSGNGGATHLREGNLRPANPNSNPRAVLLMGSAEGIVCLSCAYTTEPHTKPSIRTCDERNSNTTSKICRATHVYVAFVVLVVASPCRIRCWRL